MPELMNWENLLTFETFDNYSNEFGPHTQAVVNCYETLETISWFTHVGAEHAGRDEERVDTWSDAIDPIFHRAGGSVDKDGHLKAAAELIGGLREKRGYKKFVRNAVSKVKDHAVYAHYIPAYFEKNEVDFTVRYLDKYLEHVIIEIVTADEHDCTFYREQLTWWDAGHFVCGWVGDWPEGKHRVF